MKFFEDIKWTDPTTIITIVVGVIVLIAVWLLIRQLVCWYYKINARLREAERTNDVLEEMRDELKQLRSDVRAQYEASARSSYGASGSYGSGYGQNYGQGYNGYSGGQDNSRMY